MRLSSLSAVLPGLRRLFLAPLRSEGAGQKSAHRWLSFEQFEDRRLLANAFGDSYLVHAGDTLTVNGLGAWSNDSYNASWNESHWNGYDTHVDDYDEDGNVIGWHWEF